MLSCDGAGDEAREREGGLEVVVALGDAGGAGVDARRSKVEAASLASQPGWFRMASALLPTVPCAAAVRM